MVASTHWLATASAMAVLERGGNAFDAAAAAGFVLQVVEPHLNGPGGDMPALIYEASERRVHVICGQGTAPAALTIEHLLGLGLEMIPGTGHLAPAIPGAVGAWLLMLERHGTMRLREVLEFAIGYAEHGYPVIHQVADMVASVEDLFRAHWPTSAQLYLSGGAPTAGAKFRNRDLAAVFRKLVAEAEAAGGGREAEIEAARRAWYEGFVADAIDRFMRSAEVMDVTGEPHRGVMTGADLAAWRATSESSLSRTYGDYEVHKTPAWGQGPVFLQQLALLEGFDVVGAGHLSADYLHQLIEGSKLAYADREAWYGDVDGVPTHELLSAGYASARRDLIGATASRSLRPGEPGGRTPRMPAFAANDLELPVPGSGAGLGDPTIADPHRGDTCHLDVVDRHGNLVSATPSGGWLQSNPVIPGLGFPLGTRCQIFNLEAGLPNALLPGKRPRTTLSPSLAFRGGEPYLAFGTPGADAQDQWTLNFFIAHVDFGQNLQEAIDGPNFSIQHFPNSFYPHQSFPARVTVEDRIDPDVIEELRRRGHDVQVLGPWTQGRISAVAHDRSRGLFLAAANPRGMYGYAAGR